MYVNIGIVFLDFLKNNFLDLHGLWLGRQKCVHKSWILHHDNAPAHTALSI